MARPPRLGRSRFALGLMVLASLTLLTLGYRDSAPTRALRRAGGVVLSPLQSAADAVGSPFRSIWHGATGYDSLKKENERLRRQLEKGNAAQDQLKQLRQENRQLKQITNIKIAGDPPMVGARVVTGPVTNFDQSIQIDVGAGDGVKPGMAVVTEGGLVGRVVRVTGGRSTVQLVTDPELNIGVRFPDANQVVAVAHGSGPRQPLLVDGGVPADAPVAKGQLVTTSGLDRSPYPPGIRVGHVLSVAQSKDSTEKQIRITPAANLTGLSYVEVVLYAPTS